MEQRTVLLHRLASSLTARGLKLVTAESCTGGGIASACTDLAGSSAWFAHGFVTYSNDAKQTYLNVPEATIVHYGPVSEETVMAMVAGAASTKEVAVAVSGLAGPGGGTEALPVGTVCFAWGNSSNQVTKTHWFSGDRAQVRTLAVDYALSGVLEWLETHE